jgi:site-specific DNA recombinase
VWSRIEQLLQDPDLIAQEVDRRCGSDVIEHDLTTLQRRLQEVTTRQTKLARLASALDDDDAAAPLLNELRPLASQKRELEGEQRRLQDVTTVAAVEASRLGDLASWCSRVASNLATLTYEQKRLVLEALGVQVRVWRSDHEPRWQLDMSLPVESGAPEILMVNSTGPESMAAD